KLYRIDMRDYFRKSHGLGGVERLDLLLIDPDRTFEVTVAGYERYKPITQEIEIPFEGPGVYAVNVCNETSTATVPDVADIQRIEATALLIRSDIDVIIKSSRRQVLVFAQNMRTQQPAPDVQVLISDGSKVRFEGTTGADGVWQQKSDDLKEMGQLSVFAEHDGHIAGNALVLHGLEFSSGLQPRGYLYTDRPVYRPTEAVNIRGIVREVHEGQYRRPTQPDDERLRWKLDVVDSKGRVLSTEVLEFTDYGSFATQFRVAADAPVGDYRLIVHRPDGPTFSTGFPVSTYELPKAVLRFDFDEPVVMRGQQIKGKLTASYTYGEPVAGKTVEYEMHLWTGDTLKRTGVTDDEGQIAFEFDSTPFPEEGAVLFAARQADLNISVQGTLYIAVRAFRAGLLPVRPQPAYLAEEPIEFEITTKDLEGKPIGREMTLTALLRTHNRGGWAESQVETFKVTTNEKTGLARAAMQLEKGGSYVVRAEGTDKFGHTIQAETYLQVSDEEDATRLRLFSDRQHYKVGETIALSVHSRLGTKSEPRASATGHKSEPEAPARVNAAPPHLALITYEGEEIIGYRTVKLNAGHNPLDIVVDHPHFPNFAVSVTVMEPGAALKPGRLHAATREFTVERQLNIALKPNKETYSPREELTLEIAVTDQQDHPVQTEVGLAMIDSALLSRYPDPAPSIVSFFQNDAYRRAALRTETSCMFSYAAHTRPMVTELLAEARRLEDWSSSSTRGGYALSQPASESYVTDNEFIQLNNANAEIVGDALRQVFTGTTGRRSDRSSGVRITTDMRTNRLIVSADPDQMEAIRNLIQQLDASAMASISAQSAGRQMEASELADVIREYNVMAQFGTPEFGVNRQERSIEAIPIDEFDRSGGMRGRGAVAGGGGAQLFQTGQGNLRYGGGAYSDVPALGQLRQTVEGRIVLGEEMYGHYDINGFKTRGISLGLPVERYQARKQVQERVWDFNAEMARRRYPASKAAALEFNEVLRTAPPRTYFPEVAYWNPRIETNADGHATVTIIVPDASTKWKLVARGVTPETLVGTGETEVLSRHDFFV
ncbi:MAG: MG2 domain-containing protein, partial [Planctomycetota bacterium]